MKRSCCLSHSTQRLMRMLTHRMLWSVCCRRWLQCHVSTQLYFEYCRPRCSSPASSAAAAAATSNNPHVPSSFSELIGDVCMDVWVDCSRGSDSNWGRVSRRPGFPAAVVNSNTYTAVVHVPEGTTKFSSTFYDQPKSGI